MLVPTGPQFARRARGHTQTLASTQSTATRRAGVCARVLFHITGVAEPGLLPRLIAPAAKMGLTPNRLYVSRDDGDGSIVSVDLRLTHVAQEDAKRVERALRAVVGVTQLIAVYES